MVGPLDAKTSPPANLFRSAPLNTDTDRRSLIGSACPETSEPSQPIADAITIQKNLRLVSQHPTGRFTVFKVPNRTLGLSERQARRSMFSGRRSAAQSGHR